MAPTSGHDDSGVVAVGTVLADRYRIEGVLGSGGMGRVYRGEHVTIGKPVAVKVLHSALGKNQEATVRFQREALASGRLDHPNIVGVLDFGTLENGRLYLVMEVLTGEHLGQRLDRDKRIPWAESLAIIRSVLSGLRHAHERGVVHRDIKPDNIFLATKNGDTVVKILDFGIAKLYGQISPDDQQATRAGITVGTPKYLSPEQAVGGEITPAADLYSTSVLLYEMVVGRAPFDSVDPLTLLTAHACGDVPMFHDVAPDLEVPEAVEELVRHGLGKLVSERIGSAAEYTQRIDEIMRANGVDPRATPALGSPVIPTGGARGTPVGTPTPVSLTVASSRPARPATEPAAGEAGQATPLGRNRRGRGRGCYRISWVRLSAWRSRSTCPAGRERVAGRREASSVHERETSTGSEREASAIRERETAPARGPEPGAGREREAGLARRCEACAASAAHGRSRP